MKDTKSDYEIRKYINECNQLMNEITVLISMIEKAQFKGVSSDYALVLLNHIKVDISQHVACMKDYDLYWGS